MPAPRTSEDSEYSFDFDEDVKVDASRNSRPALDAEGRYENDSYDSFPPDPSDHPGLSRRLSEEKYDDGSFESLTNAQSSSELLKRSAPRDGSNGSAARLSACGTLSRPSLAGSLSISRPTSGKRSSGVRDLSRRDQMRLEDDYENESYESLLEGGSGTMAVKGVIPSLASDDGHLYDDASYESLAQTRDVSAVSLKLDHDHKAKSTQSLGGGPEAGRSPTGLELTASDDGIREPTAAHIQASKRNSLPSSVANVTVQVNTSAGFATTIQTPELKRDEPPDDEYVGPSYSNLPWISDQVDEELHMEPEDDMYVGPSYSRLPWLSENFGNLSGNEAEQSVRNSQSIVEIAVEMGDAESSRVQSAMFATVQSAPKELELPQPDIAAAAGGDPDDAYAGEGFSSCSNDSGSVNDTEPFERSPAVRLGLRKRLEAIKSTLPSHVVRRARGGGISKPGHHRQVRTEQAELQKQQQSVEDLARVEAIMDLLERKRAEYREQKRLEVMEHSQRARARREHLSAKHSAAEARLKAEKALLAKPRHFGQDGPTGNEIPAGWTETAWYREVAEQAQQRLNNTHAAHPGCIAVVSKPRGLLKTPSRDVVFGRLLTPAVAAFRDPVPATVGSHGQKIRHHAAHGEQHRKTVVRIAGSGGRRRTRKRSVSSKGFTHFARRPTLAALPPIPFPPMPSLERAIRLSGESAEMFEEAELHVTPNVRDCLNCFGDDKALNV
ncbi:hypothetical protein HKX48_008156 [Thoreauomyces humboldtii]|nr:hypothetical protein HKX48_008156 [Thoreauomyces humboldtii]